MYLVANGGGIVAFVMVHAVMRGLYDVFPALRVDAALGVSGGAWGNQVARERGFLNRSALHSHVEAVKAAGARRNERRQLNALVDAMDTVEDVANAMRMIATYECDWMSLVGDVLRPPTAQCALPHLQLHAVTSVASACNDDIVSIDLAPPMVLSSPTCGAPYNLTRVDRGSPCTRTALSRQSFARGESMAMTSSIAGVAVMSTNNPFERTLQRRVLAPLVQCRDSPRFSVRVDGHVFIDGVYADNTGLVSARATQRASRFVVIRWGSVDDTMARLTREFGPVTLRFR